MHNKLMVADNRMTIVGGRNVGNEYFGLDETFNFSDMDVLAAGPIARRVSRSFDIYWNSEWAYPGQGLAPEASNTENLEKLRNYLATFLDNAKSRKLLAEFPLEPHTWEEELNHFIANKHSGTAGVVFDKPLVGKNVPPVQLTESLQDFADGAEQEVLISSPYFIPGDGFLAGLKEFSEKGRLNWVSSTGTIDKEPARSTWQRIAVGFYGLLPIEDQL